MSSFYLGPRHARREEMLGYRDDLEERGHTVYGKWIGDPYQATESYILRHPAIGAELAVDDLREIAEADTFIAFTEPPGVKPNRGGRHVELGYALARGKRVIVVGPRENVFHCLPGVTVYATWSEFLAEVAE